MLSIVMPTMALPVADKNKILQFYKEEWDEQIRLIDSLPTEDFTSEYVRITPRFRANTTLREIKIRNYLGEKKFKSYVEDCIFNPGTPVYYPHLPGHNKHGGYKPNKSSDIIDNRSFQALSSNNSHKFAP